MFSQSNVPSGCSVYSSSPCVFLILVKLVLSRITSLSPGFFNVTSTAISSGVPSGFALTWTLSVFSPLTASSAVSVTVLSSPSPAAETRVLSCTTDCVFRSENTFCLPICIPETSNVPQKTIRPSLVHKVLFFIFSSTLSCTAQVILYSLP